MAYPFDQCSEVHLTVDFDGRQQMLVFPQADLLDEARCERLLRLIMTAAGIDLEKLLTPPET